MSPLLALSLVAFLAVMAMASVMGGWRDALVQAGSNGKDKAGGEDPPGFATLVIPARNAAETIGPLLQDLHAQDWPKDRYEVLVVDDGSGDGTAAIVRGMMAAWPALRLITAEGRGKKAAIAQAVQLAQGGHVVLTDADARCGTRRLGRIMAAFRHEGPDLLLMPVATEGAGLLGRLQQEEQMALLGVAAGTALQGWPILANGVNMAFSKQAFLAVGGYAGDRWAGGDDLFLLRRMRKHGRKVDYLPDAQAAVVVQAEPDLGGFWRQRLRWAGKMRAVGGEGLWLPLLALLLPWFLVYVTCSVTVDELMRQRPMAVLLFVGGAWLLWLLPVASLVGAVRKFLAGVPGLVVKGHALSTIAAFLAFQVYAPLVAVASLFARPVWKGRRV